MKQKIEESRPFIIIKRNSRLYSCNDVSYACWKHPTETYSN